MAIFIIYYFPEESMEKLFLELLKHNNNVKFGYSFEKGILFRATLNMRKSH